MINRKKIEMIFVIFLLFFANTIALGNIDKKSNAIEDKKNLLATSGNQKTQIKTPDLIDPFFTLDAITYNDSRRWLDELLYLNDLIQLHLRAYTEVRQNQQQEKPDMVVE